MLPEGFPDPKGVALPETTQDNPHCFNLFSRYYCWESWGDIPSQNRSVGTQTFPGGKHLGVIPRCSSKGRCPASFPNGRSRSRASNACPHGLFQRVEGWSTRWSQCWGSQNVNVTCICNSPRIPHVNRLICITNVFSRLESRQSSSFRGGESCSSVIEHFSSSFWRILLAMCN